MHEAQGRSLWFVVRSWGVVHGKSSIIRTGVARFGARVCNAFLRGKVLRGKVKEDASGFHKVSIKVHCVAVHQIVQRAIRA